MADILRTTGFRGVVCHAPIHAFAASSYSCRTINRRALAWVRLVATLEDRGRQLFEKNNEKEVERNRIISVALSCHLAVIDCGGQRAAFALSDLLCMMPHKAS